MTYSFFRQLITVALLGVLSLPTFAQDQVTYQLDWIPGGDKAPIYVCVRTGICAEAGLEINIEQGRGSSEAITNMATGVSDIGAAGIGALVAATANEDVPVTAIMSFYTKGPHAFYTTADKGIKTIADIKGKSITTSPFTSSNVYLPLLLADEGLSEDDITLTKSDPGALGPLLMMGQTDVIIAWLTDAARYQHEADEAGKELIVLPWSDAGLDLYSASLMASNSFLSHRPAVAKRFVEAFKKSVEFAQENPAAVGEAMADIVPELSAKDVETMWVDTSKLIFNEVTDEFGLGSFDADRLQATWDRVAAAQGLDAAALDPSSVVDDSFLPAE